MIFNQQPPAQGGGGVETQVVPISIGKQSTSHIYYTDGNLAFADMGIITGSTTVTAATGTVLAIVSNRTLPSLIVSRAAYLASAEGPSEFVYIYEVVS